MTNKLSIDEFWQITEYLNNEEFQKMKHVFPNKDFIYIEWLRFKKLNDNFKEKYAIELYEIEDYVNRRQEALMEDTKKLLIALGSALGVTMKNGMTSVFKKSVHKAILFESLNEILTRKPVFDEVFN